MLLPAADYLPKFLALGIANALGTLDAGATRGGARLRHELRATHGLGDTAARRVARRRSSQPYTDMVLTRRIANGRDRLEDVRIRQFGGDYLEHLRTSTEKRILTGGHFGYFAGVVLLSRLGPVHVGQAPAIAAAPGPGYRRFLLRDRNSRLALARGGGVEVVPLDPSTARTAAVGALGLLRALRTREAHCAIAIDPPWGSANVWTRSWAGSKERGFPLGVERLARASGCEVTLLVMRLARDGAVELHWGETYRAEPGEPRGTLANRLLDELEPYVGRFPENYTLEIGSERRWDATAGCWVD
jgi:lauroyl/myristoyl acyltransferase